MYMLSMCVRMAIYPWMSMRLISWSPSLMQLEAATYTTPF